MSVDTVNIEEQMAGSYITEFTTPKDKQIVLEDLLSQVDQDFNNQHNQQLMAPKHDTDYEHHNPNNPPSTTSVECKLVTHVLCKNAGWRSYRYHGWVGGNVMTSKSIEIINAWIYIRSDLKDDNEGSSWR